MGTIRRFSSTKTITVPLGSGDNAYTIEILDRLSHGEREAMFAHMAPNAGENGIFRADRRVVRTGKVFAYLLGWTLKDDDTGRPVPYSPRLPEDERMATINGLDPDTFDEIHIAIETHEAASDAERDALKKANDGSPSGAQTSPSPSAQVGDMSGSEASTQTITPRSLPS